VKVKRSVIIGFLLLLAFDTAAQVGVKLAGERIGEATPGEWLARVVHEPLVLAVLGCYVGSFASYISLLKRAPVGPVYAAAHGHIVTVLIISIAVLGERLTLLQALGALAIAAGIAVLAVTERPEADAAPVETVP
jgi:drug/metabolite transporter (DMT)-like permease